MKPLLEDIRHTPLLWLLVFVPIVLLAQLLKPEAHTLLFLLSVIAIIPLAALLSLATEAVATRTGDLIGGLLNATLGNLTELLITLAALRAGEYVLVKASIAGAIITNSLFMLGASFLLGGLKYHVQEFNRDSARLQTGMLFLATIAMLVPSLLAAAENAPITHSLSVSLSILLIATYAMGLAFSLWTHRELFSSRGHHEEDEKRWPLPLALGTLAVVTVLVALVSEVFVESVQQAAAALGIHRRTQGQAGPQRGHRAGQLSSDCTVRCPGTRFRQLSDRTDPDGPAVLAWRSRHDADSDPDGDVCYQQRPLGVVPGSADHYRLCHFRDYALLAAASDWSAAVTNGEERPLPGERDCHPAHCCGQFDSYLGPMQLQNHALLVLQLHAADAGCQRCAASDHAVGPLDITGVSQVQSLPDELASRCANRKSDAHARNRKGIVVTAEVQYTIAAAHADDESSLGEDHANGACLRVSRSRKACYREQAGQDDSKCELSIFPHDLSPLFWRGCQLIAQVSLQSSRRW